MKICFTASVEPTVSYPVVDIVRLNWGGIIWENGKIIGTPLVRTHFSDYEHWKSIRPSDPILTVRVFPAYYQKTTTIDFYWDIIDVNGKKKLSQFSTTSSLGKGMWDIAIRTGGYGHEAYYYGTAEALIPDKEIKFTYLNPFPYKGKTTDGWDRWELPAEFNKRWKFATATVPTSGTYLLITDLLSFNGAHYGTVVYAYAYVNGVDKGKCAYDHAVGIRRPVLDGKKLELNSGDVVDIYIERKYQANWRLNKPDDLTVRGIWLGRPKSPSFKVRARIRYEDNKGNPIYKDTGWITGYIYYIDEFTGDNWLGGE